MILNNKEYAMYKGEELLIIGTEEEIAKELGIKICTVRFYGSNSHKKRLDKLKNSRNAKILVEL